MGRSLAGEPCRQWRVQTKVSEEKPHVIKSQSLTRNPERSFKYSENDISS